MGEIWIDGVPVHFPFEPYSVQTTYMKRVIECLQEKVHGILESPTGTGKTLCLLCACIAWQQKEKARILAEASQETDSANKESPSKGIFEDEVSYPKIIYASRTHTQLAQAVSEVKRTKYAPDIKCVVIGSREQLCIHPEVLKERDSDEKSDICKRLKAGVNKKNCCDENNEESTCKYYKNVASSLKQPEFQESGILDIEDLVTAGKKLQCCPYYAAKELQSDADVIFMPYNYILVPSIRNAMQTMLQNNIVILDEAHNINKVCEEAASLKLQESDITKCIEEVGLATTLRNEDHGNPKLQNMSQYEDESLIHLRDQLICLESLIREMKIDNFKVGDPHPGKYLLELLNEAGITSDNFHKVQDMCRNVGEFLILSPSDKVKKQGKKIRNFSYMLYIVFSNESGDEENDASCYKVFVEWSKKFTTEGSLSYALGLANPPVKVINYWCFDPAVNMRRLERLGIHSILLTSGTLGPIPSLVSELGIEFPVTLENGHVVKPEQVYIAIVSKGPDGFILNSSYHTRNNPRYKQSLGLTTEVLSEVIPYGLLLFFPSYALLDNCKDDWEAEDSTIYRSILENKAIFTECKEKREFKTNMDGYYDQINDKEDNRGACFLAVCRGKVSEGLDFSNNNGRGVMITGLPYLPFKDPKVDLKMKYMNEQNEKNSERLKGWDWYEQDTIRAVNQAIGRVIRHKDDYGVILLCDTRFKKSSIREQLSAWLRPYIRTTEDFNTDTRS